MASKNTYYNILYYLNFIVIFYSNLAGVLHIT